MSHIQLNYAFLLFWSIFGKIHWKLLFLVQKVTISERSTELLRKFVFLNKFEKKQILRKIWICLHKSFFDQTIKRGEILTKTVFLLKMGHIQLNYAFLLFWSIFGKIHWKLLFLVQKVGEMKTASTWPPLQVALRRETDVFILLPATSTSETERVLIRMDGLIRRKWRRDKGSKRKKKKSKNDYLRKKHRNT